MERIERTSHEARVSWGQVLDDAVAGKATVVTRHGRVCAVVIPTDADPESVAKALSAARRERAA